MRRLVIASSLFVSLSGQAYAYCSPVNNSYIQYNDCLMNEQQYATQQRQLNELQFQLEEQNRQLQRNNILQMERNDYLYTKRY